MKCGGSIRSYDDAVRLGENTNKQLELGSHPARLLAGVLEESGVKIMVKRANEAGSAASAIGPFGAGVFLNSSNAPWRINYDLAHELFHLLTWDQFPASSPAAGDCPPFRSSPSCGKEGLSPSRKGDDDSRDAAQEEAVPETKPVAERFADAFASALLLPESVVVREFRARAKEKALSFVDCVNMARDFGVSNQALIWRLVNLRLVAKDSGEEAIKSRNRETPLAAGTGRLPWRSPPGGESPCSVSLFRDRSARKRDWRESSIEWPTPRFVATAFKCLQLGRLSRSRFAQVMAIDRGEIDSFLASRGYDAWEDYSGEISTA